MLPSLRRQGSIQIFSTMPLYWMDPCLRRDDNIVIYRVISMKNYEGIHQGQATVRRKFLSYYPELTLYNLFF